MSEFQLIHRPQGATLSAYQRSWERINFICGPLGSGKTFQSCIKLFTAIVGQKPNDQGVRPSRFYAIRNTYSDLNTTTIKDWLALFSELGQFKAGGQSPPTHSLDFDLEDGTRVVAELVFIALDRPDSIRKLRGSQVTGFWLNETKELPKAVVDMADGRHGRYPSLAAGGIRPTWHGMIGDTNAPDNDHWYYKLAEETKPEGWAFFRQPGGVHKIEEKWVINPDAENTSNLPEGYYERLVHGKSEDWISVNLANEYGFVADGKPVHPQYVDSVHCSPVNLEPIPGLPIVVGMDFGRTPAAAFAQKLPIGRWIVFDEFVTHDMSAATFAPELKRYIDQHYSQFQVQAWGDPAGDAKGQATDDTPFKVLRRHGIQARPTATNKTLVRRSSLTNPMLRNCMDGKPAFLLSPKCVTIRKGLAGAFCYRRIQTTGERYSDEPDKGETSHVVEACEYALQGGGEGQAAIVGQTNFQEPVVAKKYNPLGARR